MSPEFKAAVDQFFKSERIAVSGYSDKEDSVGRMIYDKLKGEGFNAYAVNPKQPEIEEDWCYDSLNSILLKLDAVVICTAPNQTLKIVKEAHQLGIKLVWMHRSVDEGSYSKEAEQFCHDHGITCISFGCPMMFLEPDFGHQCLKWFFNIKGEFGDDHVDRVAISGSHK